MTTITNETRVTKSSAFRLKGSLFTLTVFHLLRTDIALITKQLAQLVKQTPKFFHHMPIVLDLQKIANAATPINFAELITSLREHQIIPVGVRGGSAEQHEFAQHAGLAILPNTKPEAETNDAAQQQPVTQYNPTKMVTQPVRSGQQIYARNADLIVLAPVSHGAELLADGNIHVYGTLRGRALAGTSGDQNARIFCQSLEAELVAIAGHYWVSEDLQNNPIKQSVHIYLENDRLHVGTL